MIKQLKTSLKIKKENIQVLQEFQCKFCHTKFHKEETLSVHMCVKKRRQMEIDTPASRFGFRTFQRFYDLTMVTKKPKTTQEFIDSPYYIDFVKFGNHIANLKPLYPEKFIDFVIKNGVKLKDWCKDFVYDMYTEDLIKKEPADAATERTISEIIIWSAANKAPFDQFFNRISANEASYMIRTGKISPWVLYLSETGGILLDSFNEDHAKMIGNIIDPGFWMKKFKNMTEDVSFIRDTLAQSGL